MIKVEVIEEFTLGKFDELINIQRKNKSTEGRLYKGDIFECDNKMAEYLLNEIKNPANRAFVKIIEVIPEKKPQKSIDKIDKEVKETKRQTIRKTRRKSIAKKG